MHRLAKKGPRLLVCTALGVVLLGCGAKARNGAQNPPSAGQYITAEQIRATGASTAWEALKFTVRTHRFSDYRGRPVRIYSDRGQGSLVLREDPFVLLDGTKLGDITVLRMIPADNLFSIQVLTGPDATTYYGTSAVAGVILIETTLGGDEEEPDSIPPPDANKSHR
jgi:outer membrane receptor protein involved in Fe transport